MENKINIAEILKDCPKGVKLYSPICGEVKFNEIDIDNERHPIALKSCRGTINFAEDGRFCAAYDTAECMLFPSSEMRDWSKFFKRGDVVRSIDDGAQAVFKGWESDDYTSFYASIVHHAEVDKEGRIYWVDRLLFWDTSAIYPTIFAYHQKKDGTCSKRSEQVSNDSITKIEEK